MLGGRKKSIDRLIRIVLIAVVGLRAGKKPIAIEEEDTTPSIPIISLMDKRHTS